MDTFHKQVADYATALQKFRTDNDLPSEWFAQPDHLAIKCAGPVDYEQTVQNWLPQAASLSYAPLNNRRLASVRLSQPLVVGNNGAVEWLEIMEPRPEKVGKDPVGIDHMEFLFADFEAASTVLRAKNIPFEQEQNPLHEWLSIFAYGHEFKLNNSVLAQIVATNIKTGDATVLK